MAGYNHGQEIAENELRMAARATKRRILWALGLTAGVAGFLVLCGPRGLVVNAIGYAWASLCFEVRKLPSFDLTEQHAHLVAVAYSRTVHQLWYWWILGGCCAASFCGSFGWLTWRFYKRGEKEKLDRITRGTELVDPKTHNAIMKREYGAKPPFEMGKALLLGKDKVILPQALQYLHMACIGAPGSGKTTLINEVVEQTRARGDKGFVIDVNGAFYALFGRPGDTVLSLRDPRSAPWDFWHEPLAQPENLAASMIEADSPSNQYFWKGARAVLASLLKQNRDVESLWEDFKKSSSELRSKLADANELAQRIIGEGDGDQADGIIGTTVLDFAFLKELNQWSEEDDDEFFSITHWMNDNSDRSWVFVVVSDKDVEITKPLLRVWFDLACLAALQRDPGDPANAHTWLIIDELKTVGQLPSLPAILDKGRKYKTSVVLGFQAISQIQRIYGDDDAKSMLQGLQNQFFFRMSDPSSAQYVSDALGEVEVEQANFGISFGAKDTGDRGSLNRSKARRKIVLPNEVQGLRALQTYAKICNHNALKMEFEVTQRQRVMSPALSRIRPRTEKPKQAENIPEPMPGKISPAKEMSGRWIPGVPPEHAQ